MSSEWDNYWSGRDGEQASAALDGVGVETHTGIASFWNSVFGGLAKDIRLVDLACGAGTVLRRAGAAGLTNLTGADISSGAITALATNMPDVTGVVCALPVTPFNDGQFDVVVSQYGFEYAGAAKAATEIARLISSGGQFAALSHFKYGAIDKECAGKAAKAQALLDSGFIGAAKNVFAAAFAKDQMAYDATLKQLAGPQKIMTELAASGMGLAQHIQAGTAQLFSRLANYTFQDIAGWLDGNESEVKAYLARMDAMRRAALSVEDVAAVNAALEQGGMDVAQPAIFAPDGADKPIAWIIRARKP